MRIGISSYSGIVATGGSSYAAGVGQAPPTFSVGATDVSNGSTVIITGPATTGTTTASLDSIPGSVADKTITGTFTATF